VVEQGFDFAPVDIGARRILEDAAHQVGVLVAHDDSRLFRCLHFMPVARKITSGKDELEQRQAEQCVAGRNKVVGHHAEAVFDVVSK
jgi:hypothetical protein